MATAEDITSAVAIILEVATLAVADTLEAAISAATASHILEVDTLGGGMSAATVSHTAPGAIALQAVRIISVVAISPMLIGPAGILQATRISPITAEPWPQVDG